VFSRLYRRRSPAALTATALVTAAIALGSLALVTPLPTALAPLLVFWLAANIVVTTGITYRQTSTPDLLLARVNVVGRMIAWGGRPAGAAVIGILASGIGVRVTFAVTAVSLLLGGVTCAAFHQRAVGQLRPHDAILTLPGR
jgi:predicted MFS family arabinose efflux permease